ncbi:Iron-containing alcohol dehydrogenase [Desulfatibacillum aliphaticivorans]|uniref:Glycerol dehydrogenase n=1 Tax=Desulfatibacillum aliphaticivorans TaxID=218208 RepID=B8FHZ9_DESAL|nr:glycerol dehydrogenase [Desulfatibacillum aliphaticivorans]ACL02566.1 Iron-containing alcohol dehydrogenase [Desulfatibacillum aliphaticivorans]
MNSITLFPGRYIQGKGVLHDLGAECARLGSKAFLIASPYSLKHYARTILENAPEGLVIVQEQFNRECSDEEIQRLHELCAKNQCNLVVGLGGGKTLDAAKAAAHKAGVPVIMAPTIASTDAPCSSVCVIYTPEGVFSWVDYLPRNPDVVLVDTSIIVKAPARFLASGMGDALATWFEAESCRIKRAPNIAGAVGSMTAYALARLCWETIRDYGVSALSACEANVVTPALERVVEANTLLSGIGFESAGLAAAHAIHNGLTVVPGINRFYHGEKVAFGVLVSLFLTEKPPSLIDEIYGFCESIGLPTTLADLGMENASDQLLLDVAEKACTPEDSMHNEPFDISPAKIADMIKAADAWGLKRKNG